MIEVSSKSAVKITAVYRLWQLMSGVFGIFFITKFYSPETQGYYYTFASLLTIQTIFELGITSVITTVTAHEMVATTWRPSDKIPPANELTDRLSALFRVVWRRAIRLTLSFFAIAAIVGILVMRTEKSTTHIEWMAPWVLVVAFYSLKIFIALFEGLLEGMSQIAEVARTRLFSAVAMSIVLWLGIFFGAGLYAMAISAAISVVISLLIYRKKFLPLTMLLYKNKNYSFESDVWNAGARTFQNRMAVSWICGYVVFQILVPMTFHFRGAVEAGRMGLALSLCSAITALGSAWVGPKVPDISNLANSFNLLALRGELRLMLKEVGFVNLIIIVIILCGYEVAPLVAPHLTDRLPSGLILLILVGATILNQYINVIATFSRAFKIDPFVFPTAISAFFSIAFSILLTRGLGEVGTAVAYCLAMLVSLFPFSIYRHILLEKVSSKFYEARDL